MNAQDLAARLRQEIARVEAELTTYYQSQIEADYEADPGLLSNLPAQIRFLETRLEGLRHAYDRTCRNQHRFCEDCGQLIDAERLEACPEATRCIACARRRASSFLGSFPHRWGSPPHPIPSGLASLGA
jgi:RNA polymerase-binding transcription factor DksA